MRAQANRMPRYRRRDLFQGAGWWVGAVVLTMPFREVALAQAGAASLRIGDVVLGLAIAKWFIESGGWRRLQANGLDRSIFYFVLICAASLIWTTEYNYAALRAFKFVRNALLYSLIANYLRSSLSLGYRKIALCLVATGLMQCLAFVYGMSQRGSLADLQVMFDAGMLLSNDSRMAMVKGDASGGLMLKGASAWLSLAVFFAVGVTPQMRTRFTAKLVVIATAVMTIVTVLTLNRTAWIGLAAGGFVLLWADRGGRAVKRLAVGLAVSGLVVGTIGYQEIQNVFLARLSPDALLNGPSMQIRLEFFRLAIERFLDSPFIGVGVGSIDLVNHHNTHNVYLQLLGEVGAVGALLFGLLLWRWTSFLLRTRRYAIAVRDEKRRVMTAAMLGATAFFLVSFLAGDNLEGGEPWLVMAMSSGLYATSRNEMQARRSRFNPTTMVTTLS